MLRFFLNYFLVSRKKGGLTIEQIVLGVIVISALLVLLWFAGVKIRADLALSGSKLVERGLG